MLCRDSIDSHIFYHNLPEISNLPKVTSHFNLEVGQNVVLTLQQCILGDYCYLLWSFPLICSCLVARSLDLLDLACLPLVCIFHHAYTYNITQYQGILTLNQIKISLGLIGLFPDFVRRGLPKILDFGYSVLILWQTDKKQQILKQRNKDLFIWTELLIVWLIIGSNYIFQHRSQWSISNTRYCAEIANAKSE